MPEEKTVQRAVFNADAPVSAKVFTDSGFRDLSFRFPTDDEWVEYRRSVHVCERALGAGKAQTEVNGDEDAALALLTKICPDHGVGPLGALEVIRRLERSRVVGVESEPGGFRVKLAVPGAVTEHVCKIPDEKTRRTFKRGYSTGITQAHGVTEYKSNPFVAGDYYDAIVTETSGYEGRVPLIHKEAVVGAVEAEITAIVDGDGLGNF